MEQSSPPLPRWDTIVLACYRAHLGHVDVEVVSRIWLALLLLRMGARGIWQAVDASPLQTAVERASRQVGNGRG
jgi:hypothetical protein